MNCLRKTVNRREVFQLLVVRANRVVHAFTISKPPLNSKDLLDRVSQGYPLHTVSKLSVITPAHNEEANLALLYSRLKTALDDIGLDWEWIVVDDHSSDETFRILQGIAAQDHRVIGIRLSQNMGSHLACLCGLRKSQGDAAIVIAADLQDPPELIAPMIDHWRKGKRVVWAARQARSGEKWTNTVSARLYYWVLRHFIGIKQLPPQGADFFLIDRIVVQSLAQFNEANVNFIALIAWMGFASETIYYDKKTRVLGKSSWSFEKKIKLFIDSVASLTYKPIRFMSYVGFAVALIGFIYSMFVVRNYLRGTPPPGWSSLIIVVFVIGGIQMIMIGILGEYVWRTLDQSRGRPKYLIEQTTEN